MHNMMKICLFQRKGWQHNISNCGSSNHFYIFPIENQFDWNFCQACHNRQISFHLFHLNFDLFYNYISRSTNMPILFTSTETDVQKYHHYCKNSFNEVFKLAKCLSGRWYLRMKRSSDRHCVFSTTGSILLIRIQTHVCA